MFKDLSVKNKPTHKLGLWHTYIFKRNLFLYSQKLYRNFQAAYQPENKKV